jgi:uncharacterized protein
MTKIGGKTPGTGGTDAAQRRDDADRPVRDPREATPSAAPDARPDSPPRTIGVISDTHGLLRPQAVAALEGSALILHAGDVGDALVLETLERIAPVHAVRGNTDGGALRRALPATLVVDLGSGAGGPLAYVFHGDEELDLDPTAAGIALVVSGHTHAPTLERRGGVIHLNPGSAGPRRFKLPVSVARARVERGGIVGVEIVELDVG